MYWFFGEAKMAIGERLRALRKEKGLSKRDLVSSLPLNYSTYANYESGFREPNSEILQMLARFFGVSIDYVLGASENRRKADEIAILSEEEHDHIMGYRSLDEHGRDLVDCVLKKECERANYPNDKASPDLKNLGGKQWVTLPVYPQRVSAGMGNYLNDESENDYETMRFMQTPVSLRADFCIRARGESMEPKICDGDIVFVKAAPKIEADSIGVFTYEGEALIKRLRVDQKKNTVHLESLNKSFAAKQVRDAESLRTVGLVIGVAESMK